MRLPADRSAGHCSDDSRLQAAEVALVAFPLVNDLGRLDQTGDRPQLDVASTSSCLQQRLDDVERRSERRGKPTSQTSSKTMRVGVVAASGIHDLGYRFVRHELQRSEGHRHTQCGRV